MKSWEKAVIYGGIAAILFLVIRRLWPAIVLFLEGLK